MVPSNQNAISFSVVTGASSGIGLELARVAAEGGSDLLVVADGPDIEAVATELARTSGVHVESLMADLATRDGVDALHGRLRDLARPIDALFANAGRGLGAGPQPAPRFDERHADQRFCFWSFCFWSS